MVLTGLLLVFGPLLWNLENIYHIRNWPSAPARIIWAGEKCEMRYSAGKNSILEDVIDCAGVKPWREAKRMTVRGRERFFGAWPEAYVRVQFFTRDSQPIVLVREDKAGPGTPTVGDIVLLYYDPERPGRVDRVFLWYEYWFLVLYCSAVTWLFTAFAIKRRDHLARLRQIAAEEPEKAWPDNGKQARKESAPHKMPLGVPHFFP